MNAMRAEAFPPPAAADGFVALDSCHRQTLAMLDELFALIRQLEQGQLDAAVSARAAKIAAYFSTTAREHHEDEERHVFPTLVAMGKPDIVQTVVQLQRDHDWLEEDWFDLAPQVLAVAAGCHCDIDAMRDGAVVMAALYRDHIQLEESYLYPQARSRMTADARSAMGREMAARHRAGRAEQRPADARRAGAR